MQFDLQLFVNNDYVTTFSKESTGDIFAILSKILDYMKLNDEDYTNDNIVLKLNKLGENAIKAKENVQDSKNKFKDLLINNYNMNPKDIDMSSKDSIVLFGNPEDFEIEFTGNETDDEIKSFAQSVMELVEKTKYRVAEATGYRYILKHGIGPGTLPKDVNVIKSKELNNYMTLVWLDRFLTTKELNEYDIPSETLLTSTLKANGFDDEGNVVKESYVETAPGKYTIYTASDLTKDKQIPLINVVTDATTGELEIEKPAKDFKDDYLVFIDDAEYLSEEEKEKIESKTYTLDELSQLLKEILDLAKQKLSEDNYNELMKDARSKNLLGPRKNINYLIKYFSELGFDVTPTDAIDKETYKIAVDVLNTAKKSGKNNKEILTRLDKTLNHNDPYFPVEIDRNIANNTLELFAQQALRTIRDDLKAAVNNIKNPTEDTVVDAYAKLTGVDYYTDKIVNKDAYDKLLILQSKDPKDKLNYIPPEENVYLQRLKDLAEDLIEKVLLKEDPDFYNRK